PATAGGLPPRVRAAEVVAVEAPVPAEDVVARQAGPDRLPAEAVPLGRPVPVPVPRAAAVVRLPALRALVPRRGVPGLPVRQPGRSVLPLPAARRQPRRAARRRGPRRPGQQIGPDRPAAAAATWRPGSRVPGRRIDGPAGP